MIVRLFAARIAALPEPEALKDAKTRLQEYLQARGLALPRYAVDAHRRRGRTRRRFTVSCEVAALAVRAEGSGSSRRRAEQAAAARMLQDITHPQSTGTPQ